MKYAFIFPGQGSQSQGMLADLVANYPQLKTYFDQASATLGYDLWDVISNQPEVLNQTQVTQPAILTASYAIFNLLKTEFPDLKPDFMAGHSLGEYSALTCAGVIPFEQAVKLVELRGKAMQEAVPNGGSMYAIIGLADADVIAACQEAQAEVNETVAAVNFNSPGQVVIAGTVNAAKRAGELAIEKGARRALPLAVSVPSHCSLMQPAADKLAQAFEAVDFQTSNYKVVHNTDLSVSETAQQVKDALIKQLVGPVLWTQTIEKLVNEEGVTRYIEVGPGKVLVGLLGRINKEAKGQEVNTLASLEKLREFLTQE